MADTPRNITALQAIFPDNTAGDITPQDLRDFLVSCLNTQETAGQTLAGALSITGTMTATTLVGSLDATQLQNLSSVNISDFTNDSGYLTTAGLTGISISTFTNDSGYITSAGLTGINISTFINDAGYVTGSTNISTFTNDAGYITGSTGISTFTNDAGYISGSPGISTFTNDAGYYSAGSNVSIADLSVSGTTMTVNNLPTTNPGATGQVWIDSGLLRVSGF